jgi:hypothetical protein
MINLNMKNFIYSGSIKHSQYAIYPINNVYEPIDMKKKQLFERIIIYLRNKLMSMMTENSYKYHSMRGDVKQIFDRIDVLNRKYENVLDEVEKFVTNKILFSKGINNIKNKLSSRNTLEKNEKMKMEKNSFTGKDKKQEENIKKSIKIKHIMKKNNVKKFILRVPNNNKKLICNSVDTNKISSLIEEKEKDFILKLSNKYEELEKKEKIEFKERIKNYEVFHKELKQVNTYKLIDNQALKKSLNLSPSTKLKYELKKTNSSSNKEFSKLFLEEKY